MIRTYTRSDGSTLQVDPQRVDGRLVEVYLVVANKESPLGTAGVADIVLTRQQVTALALSLVELLGDTE